MSSRNRYLSADERRDAVILSSALSLAEQLFSQGQRDAAAIGAAMHAHLQSTPRVRLEYLQIVDADTLAPIQEITQPVVVALAARVGSTRLIDNTVLDPSGCDA
jgi:pantoate--beta-alanine ligase